MYSHNQDRGHNGYFNQNVCLTLPEGFHLNIHYNPDRYFRDVLAAITNAVDRSHISGMPLLRELRAESTA